MISLALNGVEFDAKRFFPTGREDLRAVDLSSHPAWHLHLQKNRARSQPTYHKMDGEDDDHPIQEQIHNTDSSTEQQDAPMTSTAPDSEEVSTGAMLESNAQEHEDWISAKITAMPQCR